jgi:NADH:ubiquinone oxidoreductase subunit C
MLQKQVLQSYMHFLQKLAPKFIKKVRLNDLTLEIKTTPMCLLNVVSIIKNHTLCLLTSVVDIAVYDISAKKLRFSIVYNLLSIQHNFRLNIYIKVSDQQKVPTLTNLYSSADWLEREVWDMFGINFKAHPDLRRILTDYGFNNFPLRKDFPLRGFSEVLYLDNEKRVTYSLDQNNQKFRVFYFKNPWDYEKI